MTRPFLSVVMPVHGGGDWLDAALASIQADDPEQIEVVIRDSTPDRSRADVVARHAHRMRIDHVHMPDIASWTRKTNQAVEAARGEYVCVLHQDDLWLPGRLALARDMVRRFPHASLFLTPALIVDATGRKLGQWRPPFEPGPVDPSVYRDLLLVQNSIAMPAPIFRRDAYLAAGGMDEALWYTPDWDLWFKLGDHGTVVFDPRPGTAFRIHGSSLTMMGDRDEFAAQLETVLARNLRADSRTIRISHASLRINTLLSQAALDNLPALFRALGVFLALGPVQASRYLRYSRIVERVLPRLRLRMMGAI